MRIPLLLPLCIHADRNAGTASNQPKQAASQIGLGDLPVEIQIQIFKEVLPAVGSLQKNTRALSASHRINKGFRQLLINNGFDLRRNHPDYAKTQNIWKEDLPKIKNKPGKWWPQEERKLKNLWLIYGKFLEEDQKLAWLTCLEQRLDSSGTNPDDDYKTFIMIDACKGGALLVPSSLKKKDRTRVFKLMMRLNQR